MALEIKMDRDRCVAKHDAATLIFAIKRNGNVGVVARIGRGLPQEVYDYALNEARRLLVELPAKWAEEARELSVIFHELRAQQCMDDARAHEEDLLKNVPDHDR